MRIVCKVTCRVFDARFLYRCAANCDAYFCFLLLVRGCLLLFFVVVVLCGAVAAGWFDVYSWRDDRSNRQGRSRRHHRCRCVSIDDELPRLPEIAVHVDQRGDLPRHSRRSTAARRRHYQLVGRKHVQSLRKKYERQTVDSPPSFLMHCSDISAFYGGHHGDCNATFYVGKCDARSQKLVECSRQSLAEAIKMGSNSPEECGDGFFNGFYFFDFSSTWHNVSRCWLGHSESRRQSGMQCCEKLLVRLLGMRIFCCKKKSFAHSGHGVGVYFHT